MFSTEDQLKFMTVHEFEKAFPQFNTEWNNPFFIAFTDNGQQKVLKVQVASLEAQSFIDTEASIEK